MILINFLKTTANIAKRHGIFLLTSIHFTLWFKGTGAAVVQNRVELIVHDKCLHIVVSNYYGKIRARYRALQKGKEKEECRHNLRASAVDRAIMHSMARKFVVTNGRWPRKSDDNVSSISVYSGIRA